MSVARPARPAGPPAPVRPGAARASVAAAGAALAWAAAAGPAAADQMVFTDRAAFEAAAAMLENGFFKEDFEAANVAANSVIDFDAEISAATTGPQSGGAFSPGDVIPGFVVDSFNGGRERAAGAGTITGTSKLVGVVTASQQLRTRFAGPGVTAFGADLFSASGPGDSQAVTQRVSLFRFEDGASPLAVFDVDLMATVGAFFGVISDEIFREVRIDSLDTNRNQVEFFDDLTFSVASPASVPEPASLLLVLGAAAAGFGVRRRRAAA